MELERIDELIAVYRDGLLKDTLPFWLRHAVDKEHGGFMFSVDRDGTRLDTDKGMWQHGRFTWLLATLARELHGTEHWQPAWLETAKHGIDFMRA
ncbi:MAG: N-acylglucosamine 2-epimerase, partial [Planctomycetota bacterium]